MKISGFPLFSLCDRNVFAPSHNVLKVLRSLAKAKKNQKSSLINKEKVNKEVWETSGLLLNSTLLQPLWPQDQEQWGDRLYIYIYITILLVLIHLALYLNAQLFYDLSDEILMWAFGWCPKRNLFNYVERFHPIFHWNQSWQFRIFIKPHSIISLRDRHFSSAGRVFSCRASQWSWSGISLHSSLVTCRVKMELIWWTRILSNARLSL